MRYIISLLGLLHTALLLAQGFTTEGNEWRGSRTFLGPPNTFPYSFSIKGDTTIGGVLYKKLVTTGYKGLITAAAVREDSQKNVYMVVEGYKGPDNQKEFLAYRFLGNVGDSIVFWREDGGKITQAIEQVTVQQLFGKSRRTLWIRGFTPHTGGYYRVIEDIGGDHPLAPLLNYFETTYVVGCFNGKDSEDNKCTLASKDAFKEIHASARFDPLSHRLYVSSAAPFKDASVRLFLCDALGRVVVSAQGAKGSSEVALPCEGLVSGVYYLQVSASWGQWTKAIFIQR